MPEHLSGCYVVTKRNKLRQGNKGRSLLHTWLLYGELLQAERVPVIFLHQTNVEYFKEHYLTRDPTHTFLGN